MTRYPTAQHLASWAGTTPGNNESAGKVKSRRTRPGNPYLQGALDTAAMCISHTRDTYLAAKYRRIAARRGPLRANVAVQRALLVAIWNIATTNTAYRDPAVTTSPASTRRKRTATRVRQLEAMATSRPGAGLLTKPLAAPTHGTSIFSSGWRYRRAAVLVVVAVTKTPSCINPNVSKTLFSGWSSTHKARSGALPSARKPASLIDRLRLDQTLLFLPPPVRPQRRPVSIAPDSGRA